MERYRITEDGGLYFCTFSVVDWLPVFINERACRIVTDSLQFCNDQKELCVDSFVVMPTHLHMIVFDHAFNSSRLQQTLTEFRKFTGRKLVELSDATMPASFGTTFMQAAGEDRYNRFWQPTLHPERIESEKFHFQKRDYLHDNPRRKGFVFRAIDWRWSSARWHETGRDCEITITPVMW